MLFHCINSSLVDNDGHGITFCIFFFLEKNFKHSNPVKRRIPIYISIKYRSTHLFWLISLDRMDGFVSTFGQTSL